ncbi:MAG: pilus assembly protein [Planctomycetes bacterium]|nr:pilus assembly protein [Planctomycetota bacterium]
MNRHARRTLWNRTCERGAAVVEMAVVTPLLLTLLFGVIEFGNSFMFRQILTNAAREGVRTAAIQATADDAAIRSAVRDAMSAVGGINIPDSAIEITHWFKYPDCTPNFTEKVMVTVPYDGVAIFGTFFGVWNDIIAISTMRKEGVTQDSTPPGGSPCS